MHLNREYLDQSVIRVIRFVLQSSGGSSGGGYEASHLPVRQESSQMQAQQKNLLDAARQRGAGPLQSSSGSDSGSQPVEFDHAISYVNKIKVSIM